jgi:sigma-B regulation protein RsbU (phosphoserine phosphatase)
MLMTQSAIRTLVTHEENDPRRVLDVLNRTIYDNVRRMGSDKNLTLALLDYRPEPPPDDTTGAAGHLRLSGQHESVLVARAGGALEIVDTVDLGMPIALVADLKPYVAEVTVPLYSGDVVVLYTDGITEAADLQHRLYGLNRLCDVLAANRHEPSRAIRDAIVADVHRHIGAQQIFDDLSLIVMKQR